MRYIVEPVKLSSDHPLWPDETVYYVVDAITGKHSLGCYTNIDVALERVRTKNSELP